MISKKNPRATGLILSTSGIFLMSFDALLIRLASTSSWNVAFYRGFFIFLVLGIIFIIKNRKNSFQIIRKGGRPLYISGVLWGLSGVFFVMGVKMTLAANALVFLSLSPVFAAILSFFMLKEFIPLRTWGAIVVSLVGVVIIVIGDLGTGNMAGNIVAFFVPICLAYNLTHMRKHPRINKLAAVMIGGIAAVAITSPFASPLSVSSHSLLPLALLGLIVLPFSQLLISLGTQYLPSPEVGLIMMNETYLGALWIWAFIGEGPAENTFAGGALILAAMVVNAILSFKTQNKR